MTRSQPPLVRNLVSSNPHSSLPPCQLCCHGVQQRAPALYWCIKTPSRRHTFEKKRKPPPSTLSQLLLLLLLLYLYLFPPPSLFFCATSCLNCNTKHTNAGYYSIEHNGREKKKAFKKHTGTCELQDPKSKSFAQQLALVGCVLLLVFSPHLTFGSVPKLIEKNIKA